MIKFFKQGELKLLWPFYLDALISSILWFMPAFAVVYFRGIGLNLFQISLLMMMMPLSMLLFEIPTGAIADIYGRKFSVLLGSLIEGLSISSIFFLNNYYILLFAFAAIGIGSSFNSGAREAWITDLVKRERKDFLHNYFAKNNSIWSFGIVVSGILGAFLVKFFGIHIIWIFAGVSFFITLFLLWFANEHFVKRDVRIKESFRSITKQSITSVKYVKNHPVLFLFLIASSILVLSSVFNGDLAWVTFLQELNLPEYAFGYMWSSMGVVGIFAPLISLRFMKKGRERQFILGTIVLSIIPLLLILFVDSIAFAFIVLLSSIFFIRSSFPAERVYFHRFIKSKLRATVGSVESMLFGLIGLIAIPLAGLSVDYIGARYTILASALLMIPSAIIFLRIKDKNVGFKKL